MLQAWQNASPQALEEDLDLIVQSAADFFLKVDLDRNDEIDQAEWLHYRLLENQAPSFFALAQINERLLLWLRSDRRVLRRLMEEFEASLSAEGAESGRISVAKLQEVAQRWISQGGHGTMPGYGAAGAAMRHLKCIAQGKEDLAEYLDTDLSYYDFMNHMLGRKQAQVQLYQYDLSDGKAC